MQAPYSKIIRLLMTTLHKCLLCGQIRVSHTYIKSLFTSKMMWCISCNSLIPDIEDNYYSAPQVGVLFSGWALP
ncbi:unnamed protein product [Sphagnum jensenii]|uniref:Uncharacterized protein n=1 Tax=Sphagnum jensenii TaxID=128206 RepID=A0ABP0XI06_9BRYO